MRAGTILGFTSRAVLIGPRRSSVGESGTPTLRLIAGLTPAEVASAFLVNEDTMAKRLVRAKYKIKAAHVLTEFLTRTSCRIVCVRPCRCCT